MNQLSFNKIVIYVTLFINFPIYATEQHWLDKLNKDKQEEIKSQKYYKDWNDYSYYENVNLLKIFEENKENKIVWRNDMDPIFVKYKDVNTNSNTTEIINITPKYMRLYGMNVNRFYSDTISNSIFNTPEAYKLKILSNDFQKFYEISIKPTITNNDLTVYATANYNAELSFTPYINGDFLNGEAVAIIDAPGGVDYEKSVGEKYGHNHILFPGGINRAKIKGIFTRYGYTQNPEYGIDKGNPISVADEDHFDLIVSIWDGFNGTSLFPNARFTVKPKGELIGNISHRYKIGSDISLTLENGYNSKCWYAHGENFTKMISSSNSDKNQTIKISKDLQKTKVLVIYRGECSWLGN